MLLIRLLKDLKYGSTLTSLINLTRINSNKKQHSSFKRTAVSLSTQSCFLILLAQKLNLTLLDYNACCQDL